MTVTLRLINTTYIVKTVKQNPSVIYATTFDTKERALNYISSLFPTTGT